VPPTSCANVWPCNDFAINDAARELLS